MTEDTSTATRDCGCNGIRTYECHGFDSDRETTTIHLCEKHKQDVEVIDRELEVLLDQINRATKKRKELQLAKRNINDLFAESQ